MKSYKPIFLVLLLYYFSCSAQPQNTNITKDTISQEKLYKAQTIESVDNNPTEIKPQLQGKYKTVGEIPTPKGFKRIEVSENSFADFLHSLALKTENNTVFLYNGKSKSYQGAQFAVLKIDVGKQNLQQCADACMRLRGEFLFQKKKYNEIHFNFLSDGKPRYYTDYAKNDYSFKKYRKYMNYIFAYANTGSLCNEMKTQPVENIEAGNVFIQKGSPYGHAITVMDVATNEKTGKTIILLSQSYMPAQDIHILKNLNDAKLSPWFEIEKLDKLYTPQWTFNWSDLKKY